MGGGRKARKEFVDRRNSATYRLFPRAGAADASDRVFVRVDNNAYSVAGFVDDEDDLAAGDHPGAGGDLPEHARREILELGLPDDGYNYLLHLRELRPSVSSSGGGASAAFIPNQRARLDLLPLDVKAYDATRVRISSDVVTDELHEGSTICKVAAETAAVRRVEKAVDLDVARLLEESDVSRIGSDSGDELEEDFVIMANCAGGDLGEEEEKEEEGSGVFGDAEEDEEEEEGEEDERKDRVRRLLDEQFDLLALEEYGDSEDDDDDGRNAEHVLPPDVVDELKLFHSENLEVDKEYRAPADFVHGKHESGKVDEVDESVDVIRKCAEYAERYLNESGEDEHVVLVPEGSDESEVWDCETIITTYSTLDNHPGKIHAPGNIKRRFLKIPVGETAVKKGVIKLEGKEKLPVEYLPQKKRNVEEEKKAMLKLTSSDENPKKVIHKNESKEEKKERKTAVKEERREARRAKKELKGLYKSETQKAQKVAAVTGPSSIHLL